MSRKPSIKSRILAGYLGLLGAAFLAVFIVFNISVHQYIESNAQDEIHTARQMRMLEPLGAPDVQSDRGHGDRGGRPSNPFSAEARVFLWNGDRVVSLDRFGEDDTELQQELADAVDLDAALRGVQTVTTADGSFYVDVIADEDEDLAIFLYVDVTDMQNFSRSINVVLLIILVAVGTAAVAVSIGLASSIVRPFQQLAGFARKLGDNDFAPSPLQFRDREPAELLAVMNRTAEKLHAYDSDQKTFFQNVSHELKTPLMTIRCNAEGVAFHVMDPETSSQTIITESDRLGEMIDDIIYVSKADTITDTEVLEPCDVREILSNCVESQRAAAQQRGIELVYEFAEEPVIRDVSEKNMTRALSNLVSNAIRYARTKIVMQCRMEDGKAVVTIWNDGPEITPEDLPHIFERFYKGEGGQSGIGLSIVKSVVEKHGGIVGVDTSSDGTSFTAEF